MSLQKIIGEKTFKGRADEIINEIEAFLEPSNRIIDLGAGTCLFTKILKEKGYDVRPLDIKNKSYYLETPSQVYDGKNLPFKDDAFDTCLLISVLHHTSDPETLLREAARVSKKLVIYEDAVTNTFQKFYTYFIDSVFNKEIIAPHTNKNDKEWRLLFEKIGLNLVRTKYKKSWLFLHNPIYFLEKQGNYDNNR